MEDKLVYMTPEQIEERKAKIAAIEGLAEIRAAISDWVKYHRAKAEFERGDRDFEDVPAHNPGEISALEDKYPRAAAYLQAESWILSGIPIKVRLGSRAIEKILDGEDPAAVFGYMSNELHAFYLAQQEG